MKASNIWMFKGGKCACQDVLVRSEKTTLSQMFEDVTKDNAFTMLAKFVQ